MFQLISGKALLLKANVQNDNSKRPSIGGNDMIQSAHSLGVEVTQAHTFLRESNKLIHVVKKSKTNVIDGIAPLEWNESEKENQCCLKVEDAEQQYKPLIKYFDILPELYYHDEVASPFVKGVVLTKQTEKNVNRYSTAKKTVLNNNGGFCEACDYWYRCSLREHIKSAKHEKFVKDQTNFDNLDTVIHKLPSLSDFFQKLGKDALGTCYTSNNNTSQDTCFISDVSASTKSSILCHEMKLEDDNLTIGSVPVDLNISVVKSDTVILDCEMPSLTKELLITDSYHKVSTEIPHANACVQDDEMPLLQPENSNNKTPLLSLENYNDNDTGDSGTGPEVHVNDTNYKADSVSKFSNEVVIKRSNSDSALPPDDDVPMCCSPSVDSDNAVLVGDISNSSGLLQGNLTTNVRKQFSKISLTEDSGTSESFSSILSGKANDNEIVEKQTERKQFCFSEISSPTTKNHGQFDFRNLASTWMMALKQSESSVDASYLNDLQYDKRNNVSIQSPHKQLNSPMSSVNESFDRGQILSQGSCTILPVDESSRDSFSLISLPSTPDCKEPGIGISEDSCYTPDNTLCASGSDASSCMASENTPFSVRRALYVANGNGSQSVNHEPIKLKINLSEVKMKQKKNKKKVKVKRRIFPLVDKQQTDPSECYYQMEKRGEMKIKLSKVAKTPVQKNGDLMSYWKVRKSGGCRLVFSAEKKDTRPDSTRIDRNPNKQFIKNSSSVSTPEKRKADEVDNDHTGKLRKRRKCIYLQFF